MVQSLELGFLDTFAKETEYSVVFNIEEMIKRFAGSTRGFMLNYKRWSSGHKYGVGGCSEDLYVLSRDKKLALVVRVEEQYASSADDFFDYETAPRIYAGLIDESLRNLFNELRINLDPETDKRKRIPFEIPSSLGGEPIAGGKAGFEALLEQMAKEATS